VSEGDVVVVVATDGVLVSVFVTTDVSVVVRGAGAGICCVTVAGASGPVTVTVTGQTSEVVPEPEVTLGVAAAPGSVRVDTISPATRRPAENPPRTPTATGPRFGI
jgi:hypothetical protein